MPIGKEKLDCGGTTLQDGDHAVVEVAECSHQTEEAIQSDLFQACELDVELNGDGKVTKRNFYLANTDAFVGPCAVVPDVGGKNNAFFQVRPRGDWTNIFLDWLKAPHEHDEMKFTDDEEDDEVVDLPAKRKKR
jgi:hypothetical protein